MPEQDKVEKDEKGCKGRKSMEERIFTRAEKEAVWKQKGLLIMPKSHRQGMLAVAAKEFIEGLGCYLEVRQMLAAGKRPRDVALVIQQNKELPILTFNTLKKYAQAYRTFFIPLIETVRVKAEQLGAGDARIIRARFGALERGIEEITKLEELMRVQSKRIHEQVAKEDVLGFPIPGIRLEIETLVKLINTLIEKKIELGIYTRAPQNPEAEDNRSLINALSAEERQRVAVVGKRIIEIMEAARRGEAPIFMS